jgi:L-fuconolactonase
MEKQKLRIDTHQHFWRYVAEEYSWMSEDMRILKKDHLPPLIADSLERRSFEGAIAIQARHDIRDNDLLLGLAAESERIKGVVGWVDLADCPEEELEKMTNPLLKGIRHVLADAP